MKKKLISTLAVTLLLGTSGVVSAKDFTVSVPGHEGIAHTTSIVKSTNNGNGYCRLDYMSGGGSYAIQGNLVTMSSETARGSYFTAQENAAPATFTHTCHSGDEVRLRLRNNNSIPSSATADGAWDCEQ